MKVTSRRFWQMLFLAIPGILSALEISLSSPRNGAAVPLLNDAQKAFISMPRQERIAFFADSEKRKRLVKEAGWLPLPVEFAWESDAPADTKFRVLVSENTDMSDAIPVPGSNGMARIDNLKIGTTYYWQVEAVAPDGRALKSAVHSFVTEDRAPRLLRFPNVPNVRDLGGRRTRNGMYVKQGRVFRTAGMNFNAKVIKAKDEKTFFEACPDYREILPLWKEWRKRLDADPKAFNRVKYCLGDRWIVFKTDRSDLSEAEMKQLGTLSEIPHTLFGTKQKAMTATKRGRLELPLDGVSPRTAILMQEFTSPSDGMMQIASGADWAWNVRVNGQLVFSRMQGNGKPATTSNFHYFVPVKKGKNLMVVVLKSGKSNWLWCCGRRKRQDFMKNLDGHLAAMQKMTILTVPGASRVAPEGRAIFLDRWHVRTDIDLRSGSECRGMTGSPLGGSVKWHRVANAAYGGMQHPRGKVQFAKVFRIFLDESNYPIIFHCIAGQDRTGSLAFILNGLLGVSEEELYLDWEVTGFWNPSTKFTHELRFNHLIDGFRKLPGKDLHEQIENYVLSCGFTHEDIARFRSLMLEKR